ncbi:MAG: LssY C-terminal domain-containing protein [Chloroflexota bacterium]
MKLWRLVPLMLVVSLVAATPAPRWDGLPMRTHVKAPLTATAGDPINIGFEGSQASVLAAFQAIGWVQADPLSPRNDLRLAIAAVEHKSYPKAPVSKLFLFGRMEDFAVEHELGWVAKRDHARFWDTKRQDPQTHLELWIGDASRDVAIKILRRRHLPVGTTHRIDPNLDAERSLIVTSMSSAGLVANDIVEQGIGATTDGRNGGGDRFFTDGKVHVLVLKQP